jgi:orotidine-5'-phosphate decarboxylase
MPHPQAPKVFVALDFSSAQDALTLAEKLSPAVCGLKVGKELFTATGPSLVRELVKKNFHVFLDLKFHDIPNTVARATATAADLGVWMINVHASGGRAMMEAASKSLQYRGKDKPLLTAVTVLTSFAEPDLKAIGVQRSLTAQVSVLATLAAESGLDGVVCSAQEASMLRQERGKSFVLVTPGIRLASTEDDQVRVVTPVQAIQQGSDYLVIGRPITQAADPMAILRTINEDISYKQL